MKLSVVISALALLLIGLNDVDALNQRRERRHRRNGRRIFRTRSGRRFTEVTIDQNDLRALCESKITPSQSGRRTMETVVGGKGLSYLEGEGIDKKLLCKSKLYKTIKKDGLLLKHETDGTAMVKNEHNIDKLLEESKQAASPKKPQIFIVNADSSVKFKNNESHAAPGEAVSSAEGSAVGLTGVGFKSKTRGFTQVKNQRQAKPKNLMEMDHVKETDFELEI